MRETIDDPGCSRLGRDWPPARRPLIAALSLLCAGLAACSSDDGSVARPTATATIPPATATRLSTATATAVATATGTFTAAPTATATPPPSPSATATATGAPTDIDTPTPTATPSASPTATVETCADPAVQAREPLCALDAATVRCDFLVAAHCLLPYPSSYFLRPDASTPTGYRVDYERDAMPANAGGVHIDPSEWNTLDGFSPGPPIQTFFPAGVDLAASAVPPHGDLARSLAADSATVLLDADTGQRILHFAELDAQADSPATQVLIIRPAVRLRDNHRYIVAIRGLIGRDGTPIEPERPFAILRDGLATPVQAIAARRAHFESLFATLAAAGVERRSLQMAWDFVTASTEALTGRALSLRDQGLAANGAGAPPYTIDAIEDDVDAHIWRRISGHFTVPLFMQSDAPPTRYHLDATGRPLQNGTARAPFLINIPRAAVAGGVAHPARPIVYGHGLLGSNAEVNAGHLTAFADRFDFVIGGTDWIGMSAEDLLPIVDFISDLSNFPTLPDRLQQAALNFILLGRLMTAPDGFAADPAFQLDGAPLIDTAQLYFYGISQGGIEGGMYMALSPDTVRGVLGVGAANYSLLLQRSIDFSAFQALLEPAYPNQLDQRVLLGLIQQLWDRADPQGYLPHLVADPLPGTPAKKILMQVGVHDSQVSTLASGIEARSLGIPNLAPSVLPLYGVPERTAPFDGSAFVPYDVNGVPAPDTNTPPDTDNGVHEAVRRLDAAQRQIDAFLRPDGRVENFCDGPCFFTDVPNVDQRPVVDQEWLGPVGTCGTSGGMINLSGSAAPLGQEFTPALTQLTAVAVGLQGAGSSDQPFSAELVMRIREDAIDGPILATAMVDARRPDGRDFTQPFAFAPPVPLTPGQRYVIDLGTTSGLVGWRRASGFGDGCPLRDYPGGRPIHLGVPLGPQFTPEDFIFQTFAVPGS